MDPNNGQNVHNLTSTQRRRNMQAIRSQDTKPERMLRLALWHKGLRYRKNWRALPGTPDIVLTRQKGDVHKFTKRSQLTAFAGVDPGVNESGDYAQKSVHTTKHGSPYLRKTLYLIMDVLIKLQPEDAPVYRFMAKKRDEGKPYYVYMTAGANKFLRIYFGKVKEYLSSLPLE